jgi:hypothetical protein
MKWSVRTSNERVLHHIKEYQSLLSSFFAVSTLDIKDQDIILTILAHPYALGGLHATFGLIEDLELGIKEKIQQSTYD